MSDIPESTEYWWAIKDFRPKPQVFHFTDSHDGEEYTTRCKKKRYNKWVTDCWADVNCHNCLRQMDEAEKEVRRKQLHKREKKHEKNRRKKIHKRIKKHQSKRAKQEMYYPGDSSIESLINTTIRITWAHIDAHWKLISVNWLTGKAQLKTPRTNKKLTVDIKDIRLIRQKVL